MLNAMTPTVTHAPRRRDALTRYANVSPDDERLPDISYAAKKCRMYQIHREEFVWRYGVPLAGKMLLFKQIHNRASFS
jgi:hypothetical protein